MSVLGLAIIGKKNDPLYLCDTSQFLKRASSHTVMSEDNSSHDAENINTDSFGFSNMISEQRNSLSISRQLIMYAALDWLDEVVDIQNGLMPVLRTSSQHPHWLGLLYEVDDNDGESVYGYITATNIKFLLLLSHADKSIENSVKDLLADIHQSYIAYVMNPFCNAFGPINSRRFDDKLKTVITDFEKSRKSKE